LALNVFPFVIRRSETVDGLFGAFHIGRVGPIPDKTVLKRDHRQEISLSLQYSSRNFDSSEVPLTTGVNSPHTHSPHGSLQGYQGGGGVSEERRSPTSPNKQKHRRTLLSSAAPIDVLIKVLNICKSLQLPKTFNEQKRHGITQGLRLKLKRMMNLTTRNINELTHLFCAHVRLQTAHKMHLDSQHFEHLQFEACVVFGTMNVLFGNIHFQLSICAVLSLLEYHMSAIEPSLRRSSFSFPLISHF